MKKAIILLSLFYFQDSFNNFYYGQTGNLVPNPGFDITKGKVKEKGQIEVATGWISGTLDKADLFSKNSKSPDYSVPSNSMGSEIPNEGDNYAGIVAQSLKNSIARSYLQAELVQALEAEKMYCVQFYVSAADLSKFACNDLGAYLSTGRITSVEILKYDEIKPQILNPKNSVFISQDMWEPICATYQAKGGEKFITIGNFEKGTDAELKKLQRPRGFTKPQVNIAYYYIEDVSVTPLEEVEHCYCEKEEKKEVMNIVYSKSTSVIESEKKDNFREIEHKKIFFDLRSNGISMEANKTLAEVIKLMNENPDVKIEILGNTENIEQADEKLSALSEERAKNVFFYMNSKGIDESRLSARGVGNAFPMSKSSSLGGRAQNRRVEFKILE